jgi:hypothetical protein
MSPEIRNIFKSAFHTYYSFEHFTCELPLDISQLRQDVFYYLWDDASLEEEEINAFDFLGIFDTIEDFTECVIEIECCGFE